MTTKTRQCDDCRTMFEHRTQGPVPKLCPECRRESDRNYRKKHREQARLERWGLSQERYDRLVERGCAICESKEPFGRNWSIDHRHDCNACGGDKGCPECFRDVLCNKCNSGLGQLRDDTERMGRAIEYLMDPPFSRP